MEKSKIKQQYTDACNAYLRLFCEKHDLEYSPSDWVGQRTGTVAIIGDYFVDMASLIADIDNDAPEEEFWHWYSYCEDACELDLVQPTLEAWLQGCPRYEERELLDLRAAQRHINEIKNKHNGK